MWRMPLYLLVVFSSACVSKESALEAVQAELDSLYAQAHDPAVWVKRDTAWWAATHDRLNALNREITTLFSKDHAFTAAARVQQARCRRLQAYLSRCRRSPLIYDPVILLTYAQHPDTSAILLNLPQALSQARVLLSDSLLAPLPASWRHRSISTAHQLQQLVPPQAPYNHPHTRAWLAWLEFVAWVNSQSAQRQREAATTEAAL